jgi:CRP-like cAMP-binding protein
VTEGEAEVLLQDADGRDIQVATMGRHSLFGETAVISKGRRTATVRARDRVVTFKISADVFLDLVRQSPEISLQVMTVLAQRLERSSALLQQHQSHS